MRRIYFLLAFLFVLCGGGYTLEAETISFSSFVTGGNTTVDALFGKSFIIKNKNRSNVMYVDGTTVKTSSTISQAATFSVSKVTEGDNTKCYLTTTVNETTYYLSNNAGALSTETSPLCIGYNTTNAGFYIYNETETASSAINDYGGNLGGWTSTDLGSTWDFGSLSTSPELIVSDDANTTWYTIKNVRAAATSGRTSIYTYSTGVEGAKIGMSASIADDPTAYLWKIVNNSGNYNIVNKDGLAVNWLSTSTTPKTVVVNYITSGNYKGWNITDASNNGSGWNSDGENGLTSYSKTDAGSIWDFNVYDIEGIRYDNLRSKALVILNTIGSVGGYVSDDDATNLQTVYAAAVDKTHNNELETALAPFSSKTPIDFKYGKKYALKNVANSFYLEYTTATQGNGTTAVTTPHLSNTGKTSSTFEQNNDNYTFSFYKYGDKDYMYNVGSKTFISSFANGGWLLSVTPTAMTINPVSTTNYAFKLASGGDSEYIHSNNGYATGVVTWNANTASQWNLIEVGDVSAEDLATIQSYAEFGTNLATAKALVAAENSVGGYTTTQLATLKSVYADGNCTIDNGEALINAINALSSENTIQFNYSKKYALKNVSNNNFYLEYKEEAQGSATAPHLTNTGKTTNAYEATNDNYNFSFYKDGDNTYMYNVGSKKFVTSHADGNDSWWTLSETPSAIGIATPTTTSYAFRLASQTADGNNYIHVNNGNYDSGVVCWSSSSTASQWNLVEVGDVSVSEIAYIDELVANATTMTLTIGAAGYATLSSTYAMLIPQDVKVMYASSTTATSVKLTQITDGVIPASYGVVVKGEEGTYTFKKTLQSGTSETNLLVGTLDSAREAQANEYVLAMKNNVVGFYKVTVGSTMLANKAYLYDGSSLSKGFTFDEGGLTGIDDATIKDSDASKIYYNINGQRELNPKKGMMYIVKGQKIIF